MEEVWQFLERARDDGNEHVRDLHPILAWRAYLLLDDLWARYGERCVTIESAVRTEAEQRYLYTEWRAGRFNAPAVANPDRVLARTPVGVVRGSWHMQQSDGHGHAIDFTRPGARVTWRQVHAVADWNGLWHGVRNEPWHMQAVLSAGWIPGPIPIPTIDEEIDDMLILWEDPGTKETWISDAPRAKKMADGDGNPTGRAWEEHVDKVISKPNVHFVVASLYDVR